MFDGVIKRYSNMAKYLSKDANIVHSPAFVSAVVKIMHQERLSRLETAAIASFQVGEISASEPEEANASSFAATLLHAGNKQKYATANAPQACERARVRIDSENTKLNPEYNYQFEQVLDKRWKPEYTNAVRSREALDI
ncbi:hypothetical protein AM587_10003750 [Phytophthora nicotianae]|uniref:Uncharacterized protein n=1 Tax=Phytophthora nicotianae TaxID=4792 RepID=A0A0W8CV32_PHYNI|nr:hypothetical protein AM587_10003750 [Phytophthora nicotianae]